MDWTENFHQGPTRADGFPAWVEWNGERFDTPPTEALGLMVIDRCETLRGDVIEPDGWDHEGCPSWLLAVGLI